MPEGDGVTGLSHSNHAGEAARAHLVKHDARDGRTQPKRAVPRVEEDPLVGNRHSDGACRHTDTTTAAFTQQVQANEDRAARLTQNHAQAKQIPANTPKLHSYCTGARDKVQRHAVCSKLPDTQMTALFTPAVSHDNAIRSPPNRILHTERKF